jgi:hypothetical protein
MSDDKSIASAEQYDLKDFFATIKTVAVVGYSDNPERAGHYVSHYLEDKGYEVIAINPKFKDEVNGLKSYKSLEDIPAGTKIDVVDVFRSPKFVPAIVEQAAAMDPKPGYLVMQPGAESEEAAELASEKGIKPIKMCMMAAHGIWAK